MNWKCSFCGDQLVRWNYKCPKCGKDIPWENATIACDAGTDYNRQIHYPLFCVRGTASDNSGLIPISKIATSLRGDNQHFIRGDDIPGTFIDKEPPPTPQNRAAIEGLKEELRRQGYMEDTYNHGREWYMYTFLRIGSGEPD